MSNVPRAVKQLNRLPQNEAIAVLDALEKKRQQERYISYWQPWEVNGIGQMSALRKFDERIKIFVLLGGNRSGKTELGAAIATAWALGKDYFKDEPAWEWVQSLPIPPPPNNIWVVGLDFNAVRDVLWREKFRQGRTHPGFFPKGDDVIAKVNDGDYQAFFANGSVITGKSADSGRDKFQAASVDLIWIDEECEGDIYDECYQRTLDCAGKILVTLTPLKDSHSGARIPWVYDLSEDWREGQKDLEFVELSMLDNPFVPEIEKERAKLKWAGDPYEEARLYGKFVRLSGLVYASWDATKHVVKPRRLHEDGFRVVCIDPAPTGRTAALWAWADSKGNLTLYREYYERDRIISEHAKGILLRNGGDPVDLWIIDPKAGAQRNAETHKSMAQLYREAGIPVRLAEVDEDYGIGISREYINATVTPGARHPNVHVFEDLGNFRSEIEHYLWAMFSKGELKGMSKERPIKRNDHLMNNFQYICSMRPKSRKSGVLSWMEDPETEKRAATRFNSYTS